MAGKKKPASPGLLGALKDLPVDVRTALEALDPRRRRFVIAYCSDCLGNATHAAIKAGYSAASAGMQGSWLLKQPYVKAAVEGWWGAFAKSASQLTTEIADLTEATPVVFTAFNPTTKQLAVAMTPELVARYGRWIKSMEFDPKTGKIIRIDVHDAQRAQATLAKILKLFSDAPYLNLTMMFSRLTDAELLQQAEEERRRLRSTAYLGRSA